MKVPFYGLFLYSVKSLDLQKGYYKQRESRQAVVAVKPRQGWELKIEDQGR